MPRQRKISQEIVHDEHFNSMSIGAQLVFIHLIAVSDDCGVVPIGEHSFVPIVAPPKGVDGRACLDEIVKMGLGYRIEYKNQPYFLFKQESFLRHQSYIVNKRIESQYLHISSVEFDKIQWVSIDDQLPINCRAMVGKGKGKGKEAKDKIQSTGEIPVELKNEKFEKVWGEFQEHRKQIKKPMTGLAMGKMLARLARSPSEACAMLEQSIEQGWQGVFELKTNGHAPEQSLTERAAEMKRIADENERRREETKKRENKR